MGVDHVVLGLNLLLLLDCGASPALNDLIPGRVDCYFGSGALLENMRLGQLRGLVEWSGARPRGRGDRTRHYNHHAVLLQCARTRLARSGPSGMTVFAPLMGESGP